MKRKTPVEMERARIAKAARTLIRLKHSLAADEEMNEVLPDTLEAFDEAISRGEVQRLTAGLADVIGDVGAGRAIDA